ncbi:hypothetical protein V2J09_000051 [Rumex salicifolius]
MGKTKRVGAIVLRAVAFLATACAAVIMYTSREETQFLVFAFGIKYSHIPAFQFFFVVNAVAAVYSLLVIFLPSHSLLWKLVFALDAFMTMMLTASIAAALAVGLMFKNGNLYTGYPPVCGFVSSFCDRVTAAIVAGFLGAAAYGLLVAATVHTLLDPLLLRGT